MTADPFATMVRTIFANRQLTPLRGLYTPQHGAACPLAVIARHADEVAALLSTGARQRAVVYDVLQEAIPVRPESGDVLTVKDVQYRIRAAGPDDLGLVWHLDVELV